MAIIKHLPVRNQNYNAALDYVMFQHDELTGKTILDDNGNKIQREEFYLDGINVNPLMYGQECNALNKKYHKNQSRSDVKSHHYIISFDPEDINNGLTGERAQELGVAFAKKYFPGFQTLVCTHTDGHNGSKNIHVHIMFNSLRKLNVEAEDFLERPIDCKAGYKHHETKAYMNTLKQAVMDMCQRENLHQVDLLSPPASRVSDKEYQVARKGQAKLEKKNKQIEADGLTPRNTIFQTQKQFLRESIDEAAKHSRSLEEFVSFLNDNYGIRVAESRGRISYLHPDRKKNISGKSLGAHYEKEYLQQIFEENQKAYEKDKTEQRDASENRNNYGYDYHEHEMHRFDPTYDYTAKPFTVLYIISDLRLVVNLQDCMKAQQNKYYAQKVKVSNLQQFAKAIVYVESHGYDTREELGQANAMLQSKLEATNKELKDCKEELKDLNLQIKNLGRYYATRKTYQAMLQSSNIKQFRTEHKAEIEDYISARSFLQEKYGNEKFPDIKLLKEKKQALQSQINDLSETAEAIKDQAKEHAIVCSNVDILLSDGQRQKVTNKSEPSL